MKSCFESSLIDGNMVAAVQTASRTKEIMNSVRNSPAVSFRPCDRLISLDGKELETSRFRYSRRNFDREFCHMRFAANRLVSHLESCNTANWSTIRAKFKSRPIRAHTLPFSSFRPRACSLYLLDNSPPTEQLAKWKTRNNRVAHRNAHSRNTNAFSIPFFH